MTDQNPQHPSQPQYPHPHPQPQQPGYGQQPGEPTKYDTAGYQPDMSAQAGEAPKGFQRLKMFTWLSAVLYVLSVAVSMFSMAAVDETALQQQLDEAPGPALSPEETEQVLQVAETIGVATLVVMIVLSLVVLGLYLMVYLGLRNSRNWARITGIVFAIIGLVFTVGGLFFITAANVGLLVTTLVVALAFIIINIMWLIFAFKSDVARYFQVQQQIREQQQMSF